MSRLRAQHDPFTVDGGCTCPGARTLFQLRIEGHTADCTAARRQRAESVAKEREAYAKIQHGLQTVRAVADGRLRDAG